MKKKRIVLFFLALLFLMSVPVMAAEQEESEPQVFVNPLYEDEDIELAPQVSKVTEEQVGASATTPYYGTVKSAGAYLKTKMLNRTRGVNFTMYSKKSDWQEALFDVILSACSAEDDTAPNAGDYLRWHFYRFESSIPLSEMITRSAGGGYYYHFKGIFTYMSTASQESVLGNRINSVLTSLKINQMDNEYEIIRAIYEYVTRHVSYDYARLNDKTYLGKYSAYNALCQGNAICQGYANLIYRMMREAGLSVRFIGGYSQGEGHAWNIVRINGKYYNLDSTWDAGGDINTFDYFLRGGTSSQFPGHVRDAEYKTAAFHERYPMSSTSFKGTSSTPVSYKITYVLNGGTNDPQNPSGYFRNTVVLNEPERVGYRFDGWYTDSQFKTKITRISKTSARAYTLYAKWTKITVGKGKIKYYKSDGVGLRVYFAPVSDAEGYRISYSHSSDFAAGSVKYAYAAAEKTSRLIKAGDCNRRYYVRVQAYRLDSAGKRVYGGASSAICGYVVKYVLNGGTNASTNPYYFYKRGTVLADPKRSGYRFKGWYTDAKYRNKATTIERTAGRGVVLYAKWSRK